MGLMNYQPNFFKFLFSINDHLFRLRQAEAMSPIWRSNSLLILLSMLIYLWMAFLGMGSNLISGDALVLGALNYEASKFWFVIGRLLYGAFFASFILFVPAYLFKLLTDIPFKKLVVMQQVVLFIMLVERLLWIPLMLFAGLDWYVSPLSFGIIASYITDHRDRKSTRLNSSHVAISYAVFCLKRKNFLKHIFDVCYRSFSCCYT